jgi:hypothetical protein
MSDFVGREAEGRAIVVSVQKERAVLLVGRSAIGKSALLEFLQPAFSAFALTICIDKIAPFGNFLRDLHTALWDQKILKNLERGPGPPGAAVGPREGKAEYYKDIDEARKSFGKLAPNNDSKAKLLVEALEKYKTTANRVILVIDDLSGVTASMIPWIVELERCCTIVAAAYPETVHKAGAKRALKLFDEVKLGELTKKESETLLDQLIAHYRVHADDLAAYRTKVLALSNGIPGELVRLVKYHSTEAIVKVRDVHGQGFVDREERGIAILPILFAFGGLFIAYRYIARARGDIDGYVLSGIAIAVFFIMQFFLRGGAFKVKSS